MNNGYNSKDYEAAKMLHFFPCMGKMDDTQLTAMGFNPAAVEAVKTEIARAKASEGGMSMHGINNNMQLTGWQVVAQKGIKRFFTQLAAFDAFSTTYSKEYVLPGSSHVRPRLEVPVYSAGVKAEIDNYTSFDDRTGGAATSTEVELHKVDVVLDFPARNLMQGIDFEPILEAGFETVAETAFAYVMEGLKTGAAQFDDAEKKVTAITLPAIGGGEDKFNYGYANKILSESIQPRVHAMLLNSHHYGALKAADRQAFNPSDVDVDVCKKIQVPAGLGEGVVGIVANKRCMAVGLAAEYFLPNAYASVQRLTHEGSATPLTIVTYYDAGSNSMKVVISVSVGKKLVDASAVHTLVSGGSAAAAASEGGAE